ncbi:MAG: hypothetical protein ACXWN4_07830, partial [Candidatus Limnocylindrales bacterium]
PTRSGRSGLRPIERRNVDGLLPAGSDSDGNDDAARREDGQPLGWGDRVRDGIGSQVGRLGWLLLAAGLAFGSAGMAAATQPQPVTGHRPELTWAADQELSAKLDAAVRDLGLLNADVALLSKTARTVLTDLVQIDKAGLTQAWSGGSSAVDSIYARAGDLDTRLACTPWDATRDLELSKTYDPALIDRYHHICQALASVAPLRGEWEILVTGSQTAMSVASDIDTHDQAGTGALQLATQGRYPEALGELALASSAISDATSTAADLAKVLDVSTLQDWLSRTAGWDSAARVLWQAVIDSKGTITPQVTAAIKNEKAARALLPDDNAVLQVVIDELAGNLIPQGISIENSRGAFASALSDLAGGTAFGQ